MADHSQSHVRRTATGPQDRTRIQGRGIARTVTLMLAGIWPARAANITAYEHAHIYDPATRGSTRCDR
jgi:hypothetical protein